jgi:hypothetical protein
LDIDGSLHESRATSPIYARGLAGVAQAVD